MNGNILYKAGWWFGSFFIFPYIGKFIIRLLTFIFFRGVGIPPTSKGQYMINGYEYENAAEIGL